MAVNTQFRRDCFHSFCLRRHFLLPSTFLQNTIGFFSLLKIWVLAWGAHWVAWNAHSWADFFTLFVPVLWLSGHSHFFTLLSWGEDRSYCDVVPLSHFEARGGTIAALGQSGIGCHLQAKVGRLVGRDAGWITLVCLCLQAPSFTPAGEWMLN